MSSHDLLICRACGAEAPDSIGSFEGGQLIPESVLCMDCAENLDAEEDEQSRPDPSMDHGTLKVLPSERWPQYLRRVFPEIAFVMYQNPTTPRDHDMFRLGVHCAFAEETYSKQTFRERRTPEQIVEEFLCGIHLDKPNEGGHDR